MQQSHPGPLGEYLSEGIMMGLLGYNSKLQSFWIHRKFAWAFLALAECLCNIFEWGHEIKMVGNHSFKWKLKEYCTSYMNLKKIHNYAL